MTFTKQDILYFDNHLIIVHKKVGEIVQGDKTGDITLMDEVKDWIKNAYQKPGEVFLGLVHRIDRPVSGALIFARTSKALSRMNEMIKNGKLEKIYWAIVKNAPAPVTGKLENYLVRNTAQNKSYIHSKPSSTSKLALLEYKTLAGSDNYYLLEVNLKTGRHHQIRAQLAHLKSPIKGDLKYGFPRSNPDGGIDLHARKLKFVHPVSKEQIEIICPLRDNSLWKSFEHLTD